MRCSLKIGAAFLWADWRQWLTVVLVLCLRDSCGLDRSTSSVPQEADFGHGTDNDDGAVPQDGSFGHGSRMSTPSVPQEGGFGHGTDNNDGAVPREAVFWHGMWADWHA